MLSTDGPPPKKKRCHIKSPGSYKLQKPFAGFVGVFRLAGGKHHRLYNSRLYIPTDENLTEQTTASCKSDEIGWYVERGVTM